MKKEMITLSLGAILIVSSITCSELTYAGDLDDGMGNYTDGKIAADDEALEPDTNTSFIIVEAAASAKLSGDKDAKQDKNENSIVVGPGADINGDLIIIAPPN